LDFDAALLLKELSRGNEEGEEDGAFFLLLLTLLWRPHLSMIATTQILIEEEVKEKGSSTKGSNIFCLTLLLPNILGKAM
jgi:hypothetical protein